VSLFGFSTYRSVRNEVKESVSGHSAVDVTITIFRDFCHFLAKNWRFSQKTTGLMQTKRKLAVF
jgi:hypothetical protein